MQVIVAASKLAGTNRKTENQFSIKFVPTLITFLGFRTDCWRATAVDYGRSVLPAGKADRSRRDVRRGKQRPRKEVAWLAKDRAARSPVG